MKKKLALVLATAAATFSLLVPLTSSAQQTCVIANGPGGLHIQVGYTPNSPEQDCAFLP